MTRFPSDMAGAAVLTGGAPAADLALALHGEYAAAVRHVADICADPVRANNDSLACPAIAAMFRIEDRLMEMPAPTPGLLALKLMATFCTYQRCEDDNCRILDSLRAMRDEAAALAGFSVIDEWVEIDRAKARRAA